TYPLGDAPPLAPGAVCFLDGIEQWRVVGYGGITPIVRAHAAAAIRRRGPDRRLHTVAEATEEVAITRLDSLPAPVRRALEAADVRVLEFPAEHSGPPARALAAARLEVQKVRATLERRLAERRLRALAPDAWLLVDGVLSASPALPEPPRPALGSITLSYPRRGDVPEGTRPVRPHPASRISHPVSRLSASEGRLVIERRHLAPPIGRVVATEQKPATPHQFHFWTATETTIGIGAIVRVEGLGAGDSGRVVYGVVTDGFAYSDLATPLHDVVGAEGDPAKAAESPTVRQEIRLWTAAVLRQTPEEPLQPVPLGEVHVA